MLTSLSLSELGLIIPVMKVIGKMERNHLGMDAATQGRVPEPLCRVRSLTMSGTYLVGSLARRLLPSQRLPPLTRL